MDVGFIHTIITTTSIIFYTELDTIPHCFYVEMGNSKLDENNNLIVKDYIASKTYTIPSNSVITGVHVRDEVIPPYGQVVDYLTYKVKYRRKIDRNNSILKKEFDQVKSMIEFIDNTDDNLFLLKNERPFHLIQAMKNFEITDLVGFSKNTESVIADIKVKCLSLMHEAAKDAIQKLNTEKEKFLLENDLDSVEEVELIIQMINDEIKTTTFEFLETPDDIYTLWPPILLPVPF
jgi:hypothetical protein